MTLGCLPVNILPWIAGAQETDLSECMSYVPTVDVGSVFG